MALMAPAAIIQLKITSGFLSLLGSSSALLPQRVAEPTFKDAGKARHAPNLVRTKSNAVIFDFGPFVLPLAAVPDCRSE